MIEYLSLYRNMRDIQINSFSYLYTKICCGYSSNMLQCVTSNEFPQHNNALVDKQEKNLQFFG